MRVDVLPYLLIEASFLSGFDPHLLHKPTLHHRILLPEGIMSDVLQSPQIVGWRKVAVNINDGLYDRRSEEHTSELQSRGHLVCRLLLEKKNHVGVDGTAS